MHDPKRAAILDPLARRLARLDRWSRARSLVLALVGLAAALSVFVDEASRQPLIDESSVHGFVFPPPPPPERPRWEPLLCIRWRYQGCKPVLPRIENHDDHWITRDLIGTSTMEIAVEPDSNVAELELRAWVRSICDDQPRALYLWDFGDPARLELARAIESECPSLEVHRP